MYCPGCCWRYLARFYRYWPVRVISLLWMFFTVSFLFIFYLGHSNNGGTVEDRKIKFDAIGCTNLTLTSLPVTCQLNRTFSYQEDIVSPLRIPYDILAGAYPRFRKYMSIGISSVRRKKENYLLGTIQSVFHQTRESDVGDMVVVVYLADWDLAVLEQVVREVSENFREQLAARQLLLVTSPRVAYPTLEGLKRNYGDSEERVKYRSKQNVDYAFLSNFCAGLARYHLVLEDDVHCSRNFLLSIRRKVEAYAKPWTTMAFSKLGYIGKLYHSSDLPALARFLLLFYDEMPCDWLLDHFFHSKAQAELLHMKPSLFQHMGSYSSFQGGANPLKDNEFWEGERLSRENPPAVVFTDMETFQENTLEKAYEGSGFFWGKRVTNGSHISVHFKEPAVLRRVRVLTGSPEHSGDILRRGLVEVGWRGAQAGNLDFCQMYHGIGHFIKGTVDAEGLGLGARRAVDCLRVRVIEDQNEWLLVNDLSVWIARAGNATDVHKEPTK